MSAAVAMNGITALVTGARGGIGRHLVQELLRRGAGRVYAASRHAADDFGDPRVLPVRLDITDDEQVREAVQRCGDVILLINNAGLNHNSRLIGAPSLEPARTEMETNYFGTLRMCRAFAPVLQRGGGGAIVNVLSMAARVGMPAMGSLSASKAAALRLTECVRAELAGQGTLVMAFLPSAVDTEMTRDLVGVPKLAPADVARALVDGVEAGIETLPFGDRASRIERMLRDDPAGLERELAASVAPQRPPQS